LCPEVFGLPFGVISDVPIDFIGKVNGARFVIIRMVVDPAVSFCVCDYDLIDGSGSWSVFGVDDFDSE